MNFLKLVGFRFMLESKKGVYDCVQLGKGESLSKLLNDPRNSGPLYHTCQSQRNVG